MSDNSASSQQIVTCQCLDIPEVVECEDDQDSVIIKVSGEYQISLRVNAYRLRLDNCCYEMFCKHTLRSQIQVCTGNL